MITAVFTPGFDHADVSGLWQYDYGQKLRIQGLNLPPAVEIHFALNKSGGDSESRVGVTKDGVTDVPIPDSMLENGGTVQNYYIYAFIYLTDKDSGKTVKWIQLHVNSRPKPEAFDSPEESELFREAIAAVNDSADRAETAEKSSEAWAHGHEDYPERDEDNAKFYSDKAGEKAEETASNLQEARNLANQVKENAETVASDKNITEEFKNKAGESAENAAVSESNAALYENNAKDAQSKAETAQRAVEEAKEQVAKDKEEVLLAKTSVEESEKNVTENKEYVRQTVENFTSLAENAVDDVNVAGQNQVNNIEKAGQAALDNISTGVDETLTQSGKSADAKVTGEKISELKSDLAYIADIEETITVTSPQLADIKSIKVGRISNTYHQTRYDSEPNTDSNYKTLDAIEFDDESEKSLRMNFKPSNISCYRASDGTYEGVTPVSNVIDNGDGSFSVTINANIKPKYVRISWGTTTYPNLVPLITLETEWDADADPTFIGSKTIITETTLKEKVVDVRNFSDEAKEYIHPTISNPCKYNGDEICMFGKGLCIGDSLTYGQSDRNDGGSLGGFKHIGMTYPDNLTRLTGIELINAGTAGKTFKTWWELHQNDDFSGYDFCIIALGVNDAYFNGGWTADSLTYLTNIVNAVRNANNHIPIFITTPPKYYLGYTGADFESVATGIRNASSTLGLYLIDFREYLEEFSRDNALKISVVPYGHFNAYGYFKIAKAYKAYISYIMSNNMDDFRNVQFVGTDYSYTTN